VIIAASEDGPAVGRLSSAGIYTFEPHERMSNRHIVQIFDQAGTKLMTIVLAVPNRRLTPN